jgi:hypothetical protein
VLPRAECSLGRGRRVGRGAPVLLRTSRSSSEAPASHN